MYTRTKEQIIEIIKENGPTSVKVFVQKVGITQAAVHRALNKLVEGGQLVKKGTPPKVFYDIAKMVSPFPQVSLSDKEMAALKDHYLYIDPTAKTKEGLDGFVAWMTATKNRQSVKGCVRDYLKILDEAQSHKNKAGVIDATRRISQIFNDSVLDVIYYYDFYSLIKFGKTRMGNLLLHGKQAQNKKIINRISNTIKPKVLEIRKN